MLAAHRATGRVYQPDSDHTEEVEQGCAASDVDRKLAPPMQGLGVEAIVLWEGCLSQEMSIIAPWSASSSWR